MLSVWATCVPYGVCFACSQHRSINQALHEAFRLVLARTHQGVVDYVLVIELHYLHKTRLTTCDNIQHV